MTAKKEDDAPKGDVIARKGISYPGADGKPKRAKPGNKITDAADGWPPKWVVDSGWVQVQQNQVNLKKGDE
jgi:hypothetical protein